MQRQAFHLLQTELALEYLLHIVVVVHIKILSSGFIEWAKARTKKFVKPARTKFEIWIVVEVVATLVDSK